MSGINTEPKARKVPSDFPQGPLAKAVPAIATHAHKPRDAFELPLKANQRIFILEAKGNWWYMARDLKDCEGWVPSSWIKLLAPPKALDMAAAYETWKAEVVEAFRRPERDEKKEKLSRRSFPWVPPELCICERPGCVSRKKDSELGACEHDVEMLLKGAGDAYCARFLLIESAKWHPDKFARKFKESFKVEGMEIVKEMFVIVDGLAKKERAREQGGNVMVI